MQVATLVYNKLWVQGNFPLNIAIGDVEEKQLDLSFANPIFFLQMQKMDRFGYR